MSELLDHYQTPKEVKNTIKGCLSLVLFMGLGFALILAVFYFISYLK
jgi:hypothetical protein